MASTNDAVAEALQELTDLMAISGADPYRVRAYEKAARSVAEYPVDLDTLDQKGLVAIPAVGDHIAEKILHFRETGTIEELEDLRAQLPAGLRTLIGVPGLGPRRAHQVYEELGITSLPELLDALHEQRLRHIRGWGPKSEENLLQALRQMQAEGQRIPLGVGVDLAEDVLARIQRLPGVLRACAAGSLRRMCETIGDLDLLVASAEPEPIMDAFTTMPLVDHVLAHGHTKSAVMTTKAVQVDLRVVPPGSWGAALQYFTGSKAHNVHLRRLAMARGLKLSEYGLDEVDGGRRVAGATEEEIYAVLGLDWIPPTLREDRGEIEAAAEGRLPRLVDLADIRGDLHSHTVLTDGLATMEEMVAAARERGYEYFAITDHAPLMAMQRMTTEKALEQRAALRRLGRQRGMALLHGSELNIQPDGSLDWDDDFLAGFDILVAAVHSNFNLSKDKMTRRLVRAMESPHVNVIGHPTGRILGRRPPIEIDVDEMFRVAARTGTALEINSFPDRLDLDDEMILRARGHGVRFAIDTDSHATRHLDNIRFGLAMAQRGWVEPREVINTWPLPRLRRFLAKGRA